MSAADPGPMARFEHLKLDASVPGVIFQRLTDRESLREIAAAWQVPKGRFVEWYTTQHADLYDAALKVVAADLALEALEISDGVPRQVVGPDGNGLFDEAGKPIFVDPDPSRDKLRSEVRLKLASKFDRARFGETVRVEKSVTIGVDAALLGTAGDLLQRMREKVVPQVEGPLVRLSPPVHEMI